VGTFVIRVNAKKIFGLKNIAFNGVQVGYSLLLES